MNARYQYTGPLKCRTCSSEEMRTFWLDGNAHPMDDTSIRCRRCHHYTAEFCQPNDDPKDGSAGVQRAS